jgi:DNA-binding MarR family transcriptional regulator
MQDHADLDVVARLVEQTSRSLHALGYGEDLFPAQWTALRYFDHAEPRQRTASALARFQGIATGPVTRTVRTLVTKGYLESVATMGRGAAKQLALTEAARDLLTRDPLRIVATALGDLPVDDRKILAGALQHVLRRIHDRPDGRSAPKS